MEGGELVLMAVLGSHEPENLSALQKEPPGLVGPTGEQARIGSLTQPRTAGDELWELCGTWMIEEDDQFLGPGLQERLKREPGEKFAIFLEKLFEVSNRIRLLQSGCPEAEFHHAFNLPQDIVLPEHGAEGLPG